MRFLGGFSEIVISAYSIEGPFLFSRPSDQKETPLTPSNNAGGSTLVKIRDDERGHLPVQVQTWKSYDRHTVFSRSPGSVQLRNDRSNAQAPISRARGGCGWAIPPLVLSILVRFWVWDHIGSPNDLLNPLGP
jgi:hypothetical protein